MHGFGGAASNWTLLAPELAERARVIVPDLPGHGGSSALPAPPETLVPFADRVAHLHPEPALVVGHSMGGVVRAASPCAAAGARPRLGPRRWRRDLVRDARAERALTLVSMVKPGKHVSRWRRAVARRARLRGLAFGSISVADPGALAPRAATDSSRGSGPLHGCALRRRRARAERSAARPRARPLLASLVLHGARDVQVPLRDAFEYARRLRAPASHGRGLRAPGDRRAPAGGARRDLRLDYGHSTNSQSRAEAVR
jgi:pimeloyl-ACP methyl ester carboxylesterase